MRRFISALERGYRRSFLWIVFSMAGLLVTCGVGACVGTGTAPSMTETPTPSPTSVIMRDDFNGSALDRAFWFLPEGEGTFFGRTQIRPPSQSPQVINGVMRLRLDTHNPTAQIPGDSFWGSEIVSSQTFPVSSGIAFSTRARFVTPISPGLVGGFFGYALNPSRTLRDEIDFELLSNNLGGVLTNLFTAEGFLSAGRPQVASEVDLAAFNEFQVEWRPDRVVWRVNGAVVRDESSRVPTQPMQVRLNIWRRIRTSHWHSVVRCNPQPLQALVNPFSSKSIGWRCAR